MAGKKKAEWVNVMKQEGLDDMTLLAKVTNEEIASNLKIRYDKDIIYTCIGQVLISVNPYKNLPIYSEGVLEDYVGKSRLELPPHIFSIGEAAYRAMKVDKENQCVIISGESGAGKTEAAKKIMVYIAHASSSSGDVDRVKNIIFETNPLLEAFGNAKTLRNDNSSRFGKYFEIQFDKNGDPVGGIITNFLLEKSRVVNQLKGERNFHIFYQITKGASLLGADYGLHTPENFEYCMRGNTTSVSTIDDLEDLKATIQAMSVIGITKQEQNDIWSVLSAILWLGNVDFKDAGDKSYPADPDSLAYVASLLGMDVSFLQNCLTIRQMQTQHGARSGTNYALPLNRIQALSTRDALAKSIYDRMFDWLILRVNKALTTGAAHNSIGVLDIYGFEIFDHNGFEQFCINYVNEKLQQIFIELTLKQEQEEYVQEGIQWSPIKFFNNKIVCDLIEERNPPGVFCVLDDVCKTVTKVDPDNAFCDRLSACASHAHFKHRGKAFTIVHYAGDVTYETLGMVEKNKDTLFKDVLETIKLAENQFLAQTLFPEEVDHTDKKMPPTASFRIKTQATALVKTLMKSTPHYVRCIKPNDEKKANTYNTQRVLHQIVYLGLLDNLKVRRAGFAFRAPFKKFMDRYYLISKQCSYAAQRTWKGDDISGSRAILADNFMGPDQFQIGKTKIFIRHPETIYNLEDLRENYWHNMVNRIKNAYYTWKNFHGECVNRIKTAFRVWKAYRAEMCVIIQKAYREYSDLSPFYDRRADNEKFFNNKKQRNRHSMLSVRKFYGDYLDWRSPSMQSISSQMGPMSSPSETVLFSYKSKVVVHPGLFGALKVAPRFLCLTDQALYLVMIVMKKKIATPMLDRRLPISLIQSVTLSPMFDNYVVVHAPMEYDVVIECDFKTELVYWLHHKIPALQINFLAEIPYLKKKKSNQKIKFVQELDMRREKLKAPPGPNAFYKKGVVYTTGGLPASSTPKEFSKVAGVIPQMQTQVAVAQGGNKTMGSASVGRGRPALRNVPGEGHQEDYTTGPASLSPRGAGGAPAGGGPPRGGGPGPGARGGGPGAGGPPRGGGPGPGAGGPPRGGGPGAGGPPRGGGPGPGAGGPPRGGGPGPGAGGSPRGGGPGAGGPPRGGGPGPGAGGPPRGGGPGAGGPPRGGAGGPPRGGMGAGGPPRGGGPAPQQQAPPQQPQGPKCRALYDYAAQESDELTLKEGDVIIISAKNGDWWEGNLNGKFGVFPGNYVEEI